MNYLTTKTIICFLTVLLISTNINYSKNNKISVKSFLSKSFAKINITLIDKESKETLPNAGITLKREDGFCLYLRTNINGVANCNEVLEGKYNVKVYSVGYTEKEPTLLKIKSGSSENVKIIMLSHYNPQNIKKSKTTNAEF